MNTHTPVNANPLASNQSIRSGQTRETTPQRQEMPEESHKAVPEARPESTSTIVQTQCSAKVCLVM